jgi:hypothetical protein
MAAGVLVLVIMSVLLFNFYPMLSMTPINTGIIADTDILAIKNMSNAYILQSSEGYILIDTESSRKKPHR